MSMRKIIKSWVNLFLKSSMYMNKNKRYSLYEVGDFTYGSPAVLSWGEGSTFKIGKFCSIASGVCIQLGGNHRVD